MSSHSSESEKELDESIQPRADDEIKLRPPSPHQELEPPPLRTPEQEEDAAVKEERDTLLSYALAPVQALRAEGDEEEQASSRPQSNANTSPSRATIQQRACAYCTSKNYVCVPDVGTGWRCKPCTDNHRSRCCWHVAAIEAGLTPRPTRSPARNRPEKGKQVARHAAGQASPYKLRSTTNRSTARGAGAVAQPIAGPSRTSMSGTSASVAQGSNAAPPLASTSASAAAPGSDTTALGGPGTQVIIVQLIQDLLAEVRRTNERQGALQAVVERLEELLRLLLRTVGQLADDVKNVSNRV
ncbi:hypothetical protein LXA43DRAFT_1099971 [Ganoderma leucocontextum]|nr:hypothetical protein LXA43DRAFT_1099971 [Ganoderma leucocontextum]